MKWRHGRPRRRGWQYEHASERPRYCERTGKRCYPSRKAARHVCRALSDGLSVYQCPHCGQHHLTRRDRRSKGKKP